MRLDLILHNANILTRDAARPSARAVGVLHGRIVGFDDELAGLAATRSIDLHGATVTPGFIDAHCHTTWFGLGLGETDLSGARGLDEVSALLSTAAAADDDGVADDDGWLRATGFNQSDHGGLFPELDRLDAATGSRPLFIRHVSGHMALVNTAALRAAGVYAAEFPDPDGGVICRDDQGTPTGLLQETAQRLVQDLIGPRSIDDLVVALDRATRRYAGEGITSFTEAGVGGGWIGHSPVELAAYQRARRAGRLHARAQLMPTLDVLHPLGAPAPDDELGAERWGLDLGVASGFGDEYVSLGPVKVFIDGSLLSETAALTEDYCGHEPRSGSDPADSDPADSHNGYFQADPHLVRARALAAAGAGWSIAAHAIGDRAVDLAIDILTECRETFGDPPLPHRIEHASVTRPEQLPRLRAAGVAVTPQASFFAAMGDQMTASLGPDRAAWSYRGRSFLDAGVLLAGSSDRPVSDGDVLRGIQAFVDRATQSGQVFGSPGECLTADQALAAYTDQAARATGLFSDRGSLEVGKLADLAILGASPLDVPTAEISGIAVLATIVGGIFTHDELARRACSTVNHSSRGTP